MQYHSRLNLKLFMRDLGCVVLKLDERALTSGARTPGFGECERYFQRSLRSQQEHSHSQKHLETLFTRNIFSESCAKLIRIFRQSHYTNFI
jgi:hypothetical protein